MSDEYIRKADAIKQCGFGMTSLHIADNLRKMPPADVVQVVRCKDCYHNNDCDIQYTAQAGDSFFCGFGETKEDIRKDLYE